MLNDVTIRNKLPANDVTLSLKLDTVGSTVLSTSKHDYWCLFAYI